MPGSLVIHLTVSCELFHKESEFGSGGTNSSVASWKFVLDGVYPGHGTAEEPDGDLDSLEGLAPDAWFGASLPRRVVGQHGLSFIGLVAVCRLDGVSRGVDSRNPVCSHAGTFQSCVHGKWAVAVLYKFPGALHGATDWS